MTVLFAGASIYGKLMVDQPDIDANLIAARDHYFSQPLMAEKAHEPRVRATVPEWWPDDWDRPYNALVHLFVDYSVFVCPIRGLYSVALIDRYGRWWSGTTWHASGRYTKPNIDYGHYHGEDEGAGYHDLGDNQFHYGQYKDITSNPQNVWHDALDILKIARNDYVELSGQPGDVVVCEHIDKISHTFKPDDSMSLWNHHERKHIYGKADDGTFTMRHPFGCYHIWQGETRHADLGFPDGLLYWGLRSAQVYTFDLEYGTGAFVESMRVANYRHKEKCAALRHRAKRRQAA